MFHLTITNKDNNEVLADVDVLAIVGGFTTEKKKGRMLFSKCTPFDLVNACAMAQGSINEAIDSTQTGGKVLFELIKDLSPEKIEEIENTIAKDFEDTKK